MTGPKWVQDGQLHMFGKIAYNSLRETKGVCITPTGVWIGHWDQYSGLTKPYILCTANEFEMYE